MRWGMFGIGLLIGSIGIIVLGLVAGSLRSGTIKWAKGGPYKRAPYEYDFWVVAILFAIVATGFVAVSAVCFIQAFQ